MFSKYSVKKPYTVIVGIILVIVLGVISFQKMTTDLLPSMNLPYVVVYTSYVGATPEQVESEVTRPMEASFATLTDVKKITSSSRDNVSVVIMQFNDGANMDTALIEISSRLDQLRGNWGDEIGAPVTMKLNPDMLPVAILSVTKDDMDILALSDYVEDELVPAFESLNGVASASASGVIQQRVDVTIEQSRIDVLNNAILEDIDAQLAEVERQLNDAQAKLSDGKNALARARQQAFKQIDDAIDAIDQGADQIEPAIQQLTEQKEQLLDQRKQVADALSALEGLLGMDASDRDMLLLMQQGLAALKTQLAELEKQLDAAEAGGDDAVNALRAQLQQQRDALQKQLDDQIKYLSDLGLLDEDTLRSQIEALTAGIQNNETALADAIAELERLEGRRDDVQAVIDDLIRRISEAGTTSEPTASPDATDAPASTEAPTVTDAPEVTGEPASTEDPAVTDAPEITDAPEVTGEPASTEDIPLSPTRRKSPMRRKPQGSPLQPRIPLSPTRRTTQRSL